MLEAYKFKLFSLKDKSHFFYPKKFGVKFRGKFLTVIFCKNSELIAPNQNSAHIGFKITRKVGKACKRNLIRRRSKFAIRSLITNSSNYEPGIFVIIAHHNATSSTYEDLNQDLSRALDGYTNLISND